MTPAEEIRWLFWSRSIWSGLGSNFIPWFEPSSLTPIALVWPAEHEILPSESLHQLLPSSYRKEPPQLDRYSVEVVLEIAGHCEPPELRARRRDQEWARTVCAFAPSLSTASAFAPTQPHPYQAHSTQNSPSTLDQVGRSHDIDFQRYAHLILRSVIGGSDRCR